MFACCIAEKRLVLTAQKWQHTGTCSRCSSFVIQPPKPHAQCHFHLSGPKTENNWHNQLDNCSKDVGAKLNLQRWSFGLRLVSFKQAELWKRAVERLLGLGGFMARSLLKVLREGRLWVLGHTGLIFARCKSMGWHWCSYREGSLNPNFISFADSTRHSDFSGWIFLAASVNAYAIAEQVGLQWTGAASLPLRSPSFERPIAPSAIVFIRIACPCKRFNLLELISSSCWNTSKCSERELSNLGPHGAVRRGLPSVSLMSCIKFFSPKKSAEFFSVSGTVTWRCSL